MVTWPASRLGQILARLEAHSGPAPAPPAEGPFEMVLWEIVAYLADDDRRAAAFQALRDRVGTKPRQILAAPAKLLLEIARAGGPIAAAERAQRLGVAADIVERQYGGDLSRVLALPPPKAKKALMQFPMIGEPGAEKILLFSGKADVLALESNGLRVLVRVGLAAEGKSYAATYRAVREATLGELPPDPPMLSQAHLLLRRHGQELCLRTAPLCHACPVRSLCRFGSGAA